MMEWRICNYFFISVILLYVASMGYEVERADIDDKKDFLAVQSVCNIIFTIELVLRIFALGKTFFVGPEMIWNLLDFALVFFSFVEMAIEGISSDRTSSTLDNVMMFRIVRIIRVIRIVRVMRLLRFFRPLRVLVHSIFATLQSLACAVMLLSIIMYTFGIVFTQAANYHKSVSNSFELDQYFGSLGSSIMTLFMAVTNGIDWGEVFLQLQDLHWFYGGFFVLYIIFATFAVLNVMTAQFCQNAIESAELDDDNVICEQLANKNVYVQKLRMIFANLTDDNDDCITLDTFERNMNERRMQDYFHSLDIKVSDAWTLFKLLDESHAHAIDLDQFVEGCLQLKGPATAISLQTFATEFHWFAEYIDRKFSHMESSHANLKSHFTAPRPDSSAVQVNEPKIAIPGFISQDVF